MYLNILYKLTNLISLTVTTSTGGSVDTLKEFFFLADDADDLNNLDFRSLSSCIILANSLSPVCLRVGINCSLGGDPVCGSLWASGSVKQSSALPSEPVIIIILKNKFHYIVNISLKY